jgi:hypothetical protein
VQQTRDRLVVLADDDDAFPVCHGRRDYPKTPVDV